MANANIDYAGRLVDISVLQVSDIKGLTSGNTVQSTFTTTKPGVQIITGIGKAVQRYFIALLSPSSRGTPSRGSTNAGSGFLHMLSSGQIQDTGGLAHAFYVASIQALNAISNADATNTDAKDDATAYGGFPSPPDDETIVSAELVDADVDHSAGVISLSVEITTAAGSNYNYVLPVTMGRA